MVDLKKLDTVTLVDMLAMHTSNYFLLCDSSPNEDEIAKCFLMIRAIQQEIHSRKQVIPGLPSEKDQNNLIA